MKIVVVKIGSSVIAPKGKLDSKLVSDIVKDILKAEELGYKIVLVSSGAIACGLDKLGLKKKPQDTYALMAISSLGQIILMDIFNAQFNVHKRTCAQILLTWDDFDTRQRFINIRKTIEKLLAMNVVPIINENDAVSFQEIKLGDNDCISARVADLLGAQRLIMLSDIQGLLDKERLVEEVKDIDSKIISLAKREDKTHTTGGMETKLSAAAIATASGIETNIAYGREKKVICRILKGEKLGTVFLAKDKIEKARKRWIIFSKKIKGKVFIDSGAEEAIISKGKSLLGVGIARVEGSFKGKDAVEVRDEKGNLLGYGVIEYDSDSINRNRKFEKAVIHRDNFVRVNSNECGCVGKEGSL
ncbi:MAG: glutamate 5-kinase [Candidatus Omnitrophica bacterium]|nr:glutamate 5-kinase [Candidatus Omnitrophota bacterium]